MLYLPVLNRKLLFKLTIVALLMFAVSYGMVPFYKHLCEALGLNSLLQAESPANTQVDATRQVVVELDSNERGSSPWQFRPKMSKVSIHPGQVQQVAYEVVNRTNRTVVIQAVPSYAPMQAGSHFKKLECFCFRQQKFAPGERRVMPVVFLVDSALPKDIGTVTLSYTFFEVEGNQS
ncbi:cytochrome c oxidase assembly protein [Leeia sp.]|uniref:cytochrome c oxidase assembly protein n=1 Tax=Leeia sp. TaxID=2884678 RepID=UPI0035B292AD